MTEEQYATNVEGTGEPRSTKPPVDEPVWSFRGYRLGPGEFTTAMVHFYNELEALLADPDPGDEHRLAALSALFPYMEASYSVPVLRAGYYGENTNKSIRMGLAIPGSVIILSSIRSAAAARSGLSICPAISFLLILPVKSFLLLTRLPGS